MAIEEIKKTTVVHEHETDEPFVATRLTDDVPVERAPYAAIYYVLNILEAVLLLRLVFKLLGANPAAGFTNVLYTLTNPLVRPFAGIFPTSSSAGSIFEWSTVIAMLIYALIAYAIVQLLRISYTRRTTI